MVQGHFQLINRGTQGICETINCDLLPPIRFLNERHHRLENLCLQWVYGG